ncbi:MAG TPA: hypothetical protein VIY55_08405 [Acetobacteraceae bacterium]
MARRIRDGEVGHLADALDPPGQQGIEESGVRRIALRLQRFYCVPPQEIDHLDGAARLLGEYHVKPRHLLCGIVNDCRTKRYQLVQGRTDD